MFSQACVIVYGGGGGVGSMMSLLVPGLMFLPGMGLCLQGVGGLPSGGMISSGGHQSRPCASYWNAFLFHLFIKIRFNFLKLWSVSRTCKRDLVCKKNKQIRKKKFDNVDTICDKIIEGIYSSVH